MPVQYKPYQERKVDTQYRDLLSSILTEGETMMPQQEEEAIQLIGHKLVFDLDNGFPLITERDLISGKKAERTVFNQSLGELFGFLHGARTQQQLESLGCFWWDRWVTPEKCTKRGLEAGDLGPGSYGAAWTAFPTSEGTPFNQVQHMIEQIKELPHLRTHYLTPWIPQYIGRGKGKTQKVVVAPCHGWVHVSINTYTRNLILTHVQRSCDTPVGLVCNLVEYAALAMMIAQVTGYHAKRLVYFIDDGHIYKNQLDDVQDLLATEPQRLPTVTIDPDVKDILDFRQEHFTVSDYHPQLPPRRIWTPV
jgi:thymidylate synthase